MVLLVGGRQGQSTETIWYLAGWGSLLGGARPTVSISIKNSPPIPTFGNWTASECENVTLITYPPWGPGFSNQINQPSMHASRARFICWLIQVPSNTLFCSWLISIDRIAYFLTKICKRVIIVNRYEDIYWWVMEKVPHPDECRIPLHFISVVISITFIRSLRVIIAFVFITFVF